VRGYGVQFVRGAGPVFEAVVSEQKGILPWGADHHRVFRRLNGHRLGVSAICEDLPEEHNRVTLDPVLKDGHGIPAPKIDYTLSGNSRKMMEHGLARGREILEAAGATDLAIQADMLATLGRDTALITQALDHLARLAGQPLAELDTAKRDAIATEFRATGGAAAATLVRVVLQCYYRDDRVLRSLGL